MPVTSVKEDKNYLYKLFKYDNLISYKNSITCIDDLNRLVKHLLDNFIPGIFNAVNTKPITAKEVVDMFKKYNKANPNWNFVEMDDLDIVANRSNCILSTQKLQQHGLEFSDTFETVEKYIQELC
jgi:NAD dependent epimerase/dehydratase family enzyme